MTVLAHVIAVVTHLETFNLAFEDSKAHFSFIVGIQVGLNVPRLLWLQFPVESALHCLNVADLFVFVHAYPRTSSLHLYVRILPVSDQNGHLAGQLEFLPIYLDYNIESPLLVGGTGLLYFNLVHHYLSLLDQK